MRCLSLAPIETMNRGECGMLEAVADVAVGDLSEVGELPITLLVDPFASRKIDPFRLALLMREAAFELQPPARHLDADGAEQGVFVDPPEGGDKARRSHRRFLRADLQIAAGRVMFHDVELFG